MARGYNTTAGGSNRVVWSTTYTPTLGGHTLAAKGYSTGVNSDGAAVFALTKPGAWFAIAYDTSTFPNGRWQYQWWSGAFEGNCLDDTDWVDSAWFSLCARSYAANSHEFDIKRLDTGRTANDTDYEGASPTGTTWQFVQGNNDYSTWNRGWDGYWAETAYWSVALSDAEVAAYQAGVSPLLIRPASLVFYDPAFAYLCQDQVGGRTGTETGTVSAFPHPPGIIHPQSAAVVAPAAGSVDVTLTAGAGSLTFTGKSPVFASFTSGGFVPYNASKGWIFDSTFDLETNAYAAALLTSSYTPSASHSVWSDVSGSESTGYSQQALASKAVNDLGGGKAAWDASDLSFGPSITVPDVAYVVIVEGTAGSLGASDKLVCYAPLRYDQGSASIINSALDVRLHADGIWGIK